jgi:ABC-2 type transport system ATP-binding protein
MSGEPILRVGSLAKAYRRRPVLRGVSLQVFRGEAVAIIGRNGAGKSTFLGCLSGDRVPDSGTVEVCGHDPFSDPLQVARCMGFVPEQPFLYGELTVGETLRFVAEVRDLEPAAAEVEASRLLERLGLVGAESLLCRELSQGMARKVAVTAALLHAPRLLVLDEVFNGLDRPSGEALLRELDDRRERGAAVLLASHDLSLLAAWCQRGLLLHPEGWVELEGEAWRQWRAAPTLATN